MAAPPPRVVAALVAGTSTTVAFGIAFALGRRSLTIAGIPLPVLVAAIAFLINWAAFVPAAILKSERFYDLVGALTYLTITALCVAVAGSAHRLAPTQVLVAIATAIWAVRLGAFLFSRVRRAGKDGRFDEMKKVPARFFVAWTLQALWVFLTSLSVVALLSLRERGGALDLAAATGLVLWSCGFSIEIIADAQKRSFSTIPSNQGRYITTGLWAWSRHPNYFGEILLWIGLFVCGVSTWAGALWLTALSPVFVAGLLLKGSGIPLLEARADARWGEEAAYQSYKARTPVLLLRPPRAS